MAPGNSHLLFL